MHLDFLLMSSDIRHWGFLKRCLLHIKNPGRQIFMNLKICFWFFFFKRDQKFIWYWNPFALRFSATGRSNECRIKLNQEWTMFKDSSECVCVPCFCGKLPRDTARCCFGTWSQENTKAWISQTSSAATNTVTVGENQIGRNCKHLTNKWNPLNRGWGRKITQDPQLS